MKQHENKNMTNQDTHGIAPPGTYEAVLRLIQPVKGLRILDAPCGSGGFVKTLLQEGALCSGMDIAPGKNDEHLLTADMNKTFPVDSSSCQIITCIEGIEHVRDLFHIADEFYRILAPDGKLVITTPNIQSFRSRIKFLARGTFFWFDPYEIKRMGHISLIPCFLLKHVLENAGFTNISVLSIRNTSPALPAWICSIMRKFFSRDIDDEKSQNSKTLLNAENLIISAHKPE